MSFSLTHVALIQGAAQLATGVANRMGQAMGFDEVLRRTAQPPPGDPGASAPAETKKARVADLTRALTEAVRAHLAKFGIDLNQPLPLCVTEKGSLRVDGEHPRAAEIEANLNSDANVSHLASELARVSELPLISIDLTSSPALANMVAPGGYPNW